MFIVTEKSTTTKKLIESKYLVLGLEIYFNQQLAGACSTNSFPSVFAALSLCAGFMLQLTKFGTFQETQETPTRNWKPRLIFFV